MMIHTKLRSVLGVLFVGLILAGCSSQATPAPPTAPPLPTPGPTAKSTADSFLAAWEARNGPGMENLMTSAAKLELFFPGSAKDWLERTASADGWLIPGKSVLTLRGNGPVVEAGISAVYDCSTHLCTAPYTARYAINLAQQPDGRWLIIRFGADRLVPNP